MMANPNHLRLIKAGREMFNFWRRANPEVKRIDLSQAKLAQRDLRGYQLDGANFNDAFMHGVDLFGASLVGVSFLNARLKGALLSETDCSSANFSGADVREAKLVNAKLNNTHWVGAKTEFADFTGTCMEEEMQGFGTAICDGKTDEQRADEYACAHSIETTKNE